LTTANSRRAAEKRRLGIPQRQQLRGKRCGILNARFHVRGMMILI
jgi:hypothetical protein